MPRVHTLKARKNYPDIGVKKGETYYKWSTRITIGKSYRSQIHRSKTMPTRSQLTNSEFYGAVYAAFDNPDGFNSPDDIRSLAEEVRNIGEEQQGKLDNMPEGLQQGATGEMIQERIDACDSSADELESLADEWEQAEEEHANEEPEEGEEKEEFDPSEFIDRVGECEPSC